MNREQTIDWLWECSNHGTQREDIEAAYNAGLAAKNPDSSQEQLLEHLKIVQQALGEMRHAALNPNWYTNAEKGARSRFVMWDGRGVEALQAVIRELPLAIENAVAAEREACAQVCESRSTPGTGSVAILNGAADEIRARTAAGVIHKPTSGS